MQLHAFESNRPRILKYPILASRTLGLLLREGPCVLVVQNPSIALATLALMCRPLFRYRLIVDAHNAALQVEAGPRRYLAPLYRLVQRRADRTLVSNTTLAGFVEANGGRAIVLPDPLPDVAGVRAGSRPLGRQVTFICTFALDEPWLEAMSAVDDIPEDVFMYVTGRVPGWLARETIPKNPRLRLTGFLPDRDYLNLLARSDVVLDLTRRENCLVCGAYEAVALGVPLVLSDTAALRAYFRQGVVYAVNSKAGIATALREALARHDELRAEIAALRSDLVEDWERQFQLLTAYIKST